MADLAALNRELISRAEAVDSPQRVLPQSGTGNVHSAEDWEELRLPEIERQQKARKELVFRADAAFAKPEIYEVLEEEARSSSH